MITETPTRDLCLSLVRADSEDEVHDILSESPIAQDANWIPLGDIENNLSIAGNQQSSATAALVEKVVNSIDSLLVMECLLRGTDPESPGAPANMTDAAAEFFGIPSGNIANLAPPDRARLADGIHVVATGSKTSPSYTIVDKGEGQRPCDFSTTFCSLVRSNKLRIPFVQGKYNMGGCGVLPFCGSRNMQLIVSRRHPKLTVGETAPEKAGWGWTVIRRREPDAGRRSSFFEYLAPGGKVPTFLADTLPVLASRDSAYEKPLEWGSLLKLYDYQIDYPSAVVFDLNFELSRRLYHLALPVRLYERRDYRGHSMQTILTGMSVRLEDDRAGVLESGFPDSGVIAVEGVGDVPIQVSVFKKAKGKSLVPANSSILFLVNGQVHGALGRPFCTRQSVGLDFLKADLMVVLDCSTIPARIREDLFMPSRDRLRVCSAKQAFEIALESYLHEHPELQRLNRVRRDDELRGRLADDRPLTEALKHVIDDSPELRSLFQAGDRIKTPDMLGDEPEEFEGLRFPTFFRPFRSAEDSGPLHTLCPLGGYGRARFETDAVNDYFTRPDEPGVISVTPEDVFERVHLHNGRANLTLRSPAGAEVGTELPVAVDVSDPSRSEPFRHYLRLTVVQPREPSDGEEHDRPAQSGAISLPKIVEVTRDQWQQEEFDAESGLTMNHDVDGGLIAKVNMDNEHLLGHLERTDETDREIVRRQFVYGLVLAGVSLWKELVEDEDRDKLLRTTTKAIARVLLPTISVLGQLDRRLSHPD